VHKYVGGMNLIFQERSKNMSAKNLFNEEPVSWKVDEIEVNATLTRPEGEGPHPAVIFVAGSGPTDRNWNTPLIPGTNGSGALLARELSEQGYITLRYDKRASGPHAPENVHRMAGKISMQGHLAELSGGVSLLIREEDVNPAKIFVLTNSEGCVHALNYQTQSGNPLFAGMVLTSAFARAAGELARSQITAQLETVPGGDAMLSAYDTAMDDFIAGRNVSIPEFLPEALQQVIQAITQPLNFPFSRELWIFNPVAKLAEVSVPVLIVLGKKDIQVDWQTDGALFEELANEHDNVSILYLENANHVLKFEPKPRSQLTPAEVMTTYSAEDVLLDPESVEAITSWLQAVLTTPG
jgi:alpha-beta hydrolase superfamily lysophospholipase